MKEIFIVYNLLFWMEGDVVSYSNLSSFLVDIGGDPDAVFTSQLQLYQRESRAALQTPCIS